MSRRPTPADPAREFMRAFRGIVGRHQAWRVFADFCELAALALAQTAGFEQEREDRYVQVMSAYEGEEPHRLSEMLGQTAAGVKGMETDFLGSRFMELELSSHWHGQFFTPMAVCQLMAEVTLSGDLHQVMADRGFITVHEPASGAGAMLIAMARALERAGYDPRRQMYVTAVDVDPTAVRMCFIQLALLGIPAIVYEGNTLSMEMRRGWVTPAMVVDPAAELPRPEAAA